MDLLFLAMGVRELARNVRGDVVRRQLDHVALARMLISGFGVAMVQSAWECNSSLMRDIALSTILSLIVGGIIALCLTELSPCRPGTDSDNRELVGTVMAGFSLAPCIMDAITMTLVGKLDKRDIESCAPTVFETVVAYLLIYTTLVISSSVCIYLRVRTVTFNEETTTNVPPQQPPMQPPIQYGITESGRERIETRIITRRPSRESSKKSSEEESSSSSKCAVCLGEFLGRERIDILPCGHVYHHACIEQWLVRASVCPECKQDIMTAQDLRVTPTEDFVLRPPSEAINIGV